MELDMASLNQEEIDNLFKQEEQLYTPERHKSFLPDTSFLAIFEVSFFFY